MRRKNFNAIMCKAVEFKMSVHSTEQCYSFFLLYLSLSCPILSCVRFFFIIWNTSQKMLRAAERKNAETACNIGNLSRTSLLRDSLNTVLQALLLFLCHMFGTDACNTGLLYPEATEGKKHVTNQIRHWNVLRLLRFI